MVYLNPALGLEPTGGVALVEGLEGSSGIGNLLQEHHGCDGVRLVAGLLVHAHAVHVEDVGVNLAVLAGDTGDVGGQRVHKDGVLAVGGLLHELGRGAPILMRSVLSEQLLLERSDAGVVALGVQLVRFSMAANGAQLLGITMSAPSKASAMVLTCLKVVPDSAA